MTESSSLTTLNPLANAFPVTAIPNQQSPLLNGTTSDTNAPDEEEYTIKCICGYADDDGNTVYCEKCDTWQHIECYYPSKKVPDEHFCAECFPRELDAKRAAERQRRHREALDGGDRRVKRPNSKSQKKKHKDSITNTEQINGWHSHDRFEHLVSGRDQPPPTKKPKTSHRTSGSVASLNGDSRKRASSNLLAYPSPSKSPQDHLRYPPIPVYTQEFLDLYDQDQGSTDAQGNEHTIQALNNLSSWRTDPSMTARNGDQPSAQSPFVRASRFQDESSYPAVSLQTAQNRDIEINGKTPTWKYLRIQTSVKKDDIIGEIRGEVGMLQEYCIDPPTPNRWQELQHPDPFVFFHPHMNIYIDGRKAGSQFRYLRRSCSPNVTIKTFVSDDGQWRHCFVAREDIPAGKELTAMWYIKPNLMNGEQDASTYSQQCEWVSRILANFGDCACNKGSHCAFATLDRRQIPANPDSVGPVKVSKKRKTKSKNAVSPMSTGQATNSRAGSEALKQEDEDLDQRSSSGSARTGSKSRDITPINVAALDADPMLGGEVTAREMRKIKELERLERNQAQQKKKQQQKRASGGPALNTPNANAYKTNGRSASPYSNSPAVGAETYNGSPTPRLLNLQQQRSIQGKAAHPVPARPVYTDAATQTEPEDEPIEMPAPKRRKFETRTQKLLRRLLANRARHDEQRKFEPQQLASMSPTASNPMAAASDDVDTKDASAGLSPASLRSAPLPSPSSSSDAHSASPSTSPTYPLPSQAAHSQQNFKVPAAPKLQLSNLPPVPTFTSQATSSTTTPGGLTPSGTVQSPLTTSGSYLGITPTAVTPSPAKKKLSLGDYMSRRHTNTSSTPIAEKAALQDVPRKESDASNTDAAPLLKPNDSVKQEAAMQPGAEGSAIEDVPMKDADADPDDEPDYSPPEPASVAEPAEPEPKKESPALSVLTSTAPAPAPAPANPASLSPEVSQVLAQLASLSGKSRSPSANS